MIPLYAAVLSEFSLMSRHYVWHQSEELFGQRLRHESSRGRSQCMGSRRAGLGLRGGRTAPCRAPEASSFKSPTPLIQESSELRSAELRSCGLGDIGRLLSGPVQAPCARSV